MSLQKFCLPWESCPADVGDPERHEAENDCSVPSGISVLDRLIKTCPVWLQLCMDPDQAVDILKKQGAGVFLITRDVERKCMVLWVHVTSNNEQSEVLHYNIKEEKTMMYLESSVLVFEDIFKLAAFYCVSRDVLSFPLKLPQVIAAAETYKDLESFSNLGTGFWDSTFTDENKLTVAKQCICTSNGDFQTCSVKSSHHIQIEAKGCTCEIKISVGSGRLWFVNPIFIEECSNVLAAEKLPLSNCVANSEIKTHKIVYRRPPPPPPPSVQNPPLPSVPPSGPPPNYKHSHSYTSPLKSPHPPSAAPPSSCLLRSSSNQPMAQSGPSLTSHVPCVPQTPPSSHMPPASQTPPLCQVSQNLSQLKDLPNALTDVCVEVQPLAQSCEEMKINSTEEKKDSAEHAICSLGEQNQKSAMSAPAIPKRRQSGKILENKGNSMRKKEQQTEGQSKDQAEAHLNLETIIKKYKGIPEQQFISQGKINKPPPVPPPRTKKLSHRCPPAPPAQRSPVKDLRSQKQSRLSDIKHNGRTSQSDFSKYKDFAKNKEGCTPLSTKELKSSDTCLNSPASGFTISLTNPEQDSLSTSSAEDDHDQEKVSSPSIRKSHSFMLDKAKNRLSIVTTNVFSAFMSAERKLQKKVTELAQDKESYFGNLVQDYKAYSLEIMGKQSSSTEMLQEIRLMMTQLKSYLVQSAELKAMIDSTVYTDDQIEAIVEAALCKCMLKPLKSPIEGYLREIHTKDGSFRLLKENQMVIQDITTTDLGVTTSVPEINVMEKITQKFSVMHKTYSPEKKVAYLLKACKLIYDSMATGNPGKIHGADDFLPVLMYVLARCDLTELLLDVEYMMELMDPTLQLGEGSYYLTTTYGALEHIKYYDKITVTRQLSVEVQDSIHRWERRRTLNKVRVSRSSIQDFITIYFEELDSKSRTLVIKPDTNVELLLQDCAEKFQVLDPNYGLYVQVNEHSVRLADDALPHHIKSNLLKSDQKLDFHFVYKLTSASDNVVKELDFL
ncbi:ras and Rab interactor 3 isoform X2 [Xenopus laevis]|uniref:Ras and Rab interactor 3 isoform X2 n=1 Tax=Xenopus laevis TaxID=8355 RepID=A0A8J0TLI8_XENLA|nr:ras and Rab interactor 3 isoform X2 [Xenopus laevis]